MVTTPICDFVAGYIEKAPLRLHMPGHKGAAYLGFEPFDITEIPGADSLYDADGIIRESEQNASALFGARSFYSTEGSSHAIRAMLALVCQIARGSGKKPVLWAGRNAHTALLSAAALLDLELVWLYSSGAGTYLSCEIQARALEKQLKGASELPTAVYITSPDYLGDQSDIAALSAVCHKYGVLLLVDNAHGAYLRFLPEPAHPMELGADLCCDSAHKTLPVLTGGAYLHLAQTMDALSDVEVKAALRLFGSTSPSYLILQSLDMANRYLGEGFPQQLRAYLPLVEGAKKNLARHGFTLVGTEPMKLTLATKPYGYTGDQLAEALLKRGITAEFSDPDHIVFMLSPSLGEEGLSRLTGALTAIPRTAAMQEAAPQPSHPSPKMPVREAMLSPFEVLPVEQCRGRVLAQASVGCPPAVPIVVSGEEIDEDCLRCFSYYGIKQCKVVK